jgi:hypothetical protein
MSMHEHGENTIFFHIEAKICMKNISVMSGVESDTFPPR